jgi:transcriptional regulator with XRE-family HTH domain
MNKEIGIKLRHIRKHHGLSLLDVQKMSDGIFTVVSVGAYERGNRTISLPKFIELCELYKVPAHVVLKHERMTCRIMCEDTYV